MTGFPPEGVYVIISSDAVTVTNQPIDVGSAFSTSSDTSLPFPLFFSNTKILFSSINAILVGDDKL